MTKKTIGYMAACGLALTALLAAPNDALASFCFYCGSNSATVGDKIVFTELNVHGKRRPGGPRIIAMKLAGGKDVQLKVEGQHLRAMLGNVTLPNEELLGLLITIAMKDGRQYVLRLTDLCDERNCKNGPPLQSWAAPIAQVPYYDFRVRKTKTSNQVLPADEDRKPNDDDFTFKEHLCRGNYLDKDVRWGGAVNAAVVFAGDEYKQHRVSKIDVEKGWFNLACAGDAASKMHLLRHTDASSVPPSVTTTLEQRTAMLRALTADYCGTGHAWTADGTPLLWRDANDWYGTAPAEIAPTTDIEAVWGPRGALCLTTPRRKPNPQPDCQPPATTEKEVSAFCKDHKRIYSNLATDGARTPELPKCKGTWADWKAKSKAHVLTVNTSDKLPPYCDKPPTPGP